MNAAKESPRNIDEYIAGFPRDVQEILERIRATIKNVAPEAEEAIKYQIPTFVLNGNLVHFAAFKNHVGFYPTPSGIEAFKEELSPYDGAKGSVKFPIDKPMPLGLIEQIVNFRVEEARSRSTTKKRDR
ncbi:MAG: iron chaperone [Chloroflexota bacterium]